MKFLLFMFCLSVFIATVVGLFYVGLWLVHETAYRRGKRGAKNEHDA